MKAERGTSAIGKQARSVTSVRPSDLPSNWELAILDRMSPNARVENIDASDWLRRYPKQSARFIAAARSSHPALWFDEVMRLAEAAMVMGDTDALTLCATYIADDPMTPFGKGRKRRILRALRKRAALIPNHLKERIVAVATRLKASKFKPQEYKDILRLVESFGARPDYSIRTAP